MRVKLGVSAVVAAVALAAPAFADDGGRPLSTALSGAEECNSLGVCGVGDPDGTGTADLRINPGQGEVCFTITVANIGAAGTSVRAHIHAAPAGSNGGIVVPLVEPAGPLPASGVLEGCQAADRELLLDILLNPEQYYVNVHTPDFPAGAIRGQLGD
jgi:CHRD domain